MRVDAGVGRLHKGARRLFFANCFTLLPAVPDLVKGAINPLFSLLAEVVVATPKGMRASQFAVNGSDAIHVYSDTNHIWLQLRRDVPTDQDIGRSSFKVALCMTPGTAHKLGLELLNIAEKNKIKMKAGIPPATVPKPAKPKM